MLKFEDIKVGDVLDIGFFDAEEVVFKGVELLVTTNSRKKESVWDSSDADIITYHQPKPTKESILRELGYNPNASFPPNLVYTLSRAVQKIGELPKDKIKILFDLGE